MYQLGALMPARESRVVEFKAGGGNYTTKILPAHINKYGSAFLNSSGGTLCIGVNDDGNMLSIPAPTPWGGTCKIHLYMGIWDRVGRLVVV